MKADLIARAAVLILLTCVAAYSAPQDADSIVARSVEANQTDWNAAPQYDYTEMDRARDGSTRTCRVTMILGSPYQRLIAVNGKALSPDEEAGEQQKLESAVAARAGESPKERAERIANYEQGRKRDHLLMQQLTVAFHFTLLDEQELGGHSVFVLQATPRADYQPPNLQAQVLPGMQGKLWIDRDTYQWVRVEARVIHPVNIEGFLARVEPGTRFDLEKAPVEKGLWLPSHFAERSRARVFLFFPHSTQRDESYFDYHRSASGHSAAAGGNGNSRSRRHS